MTEPMDQTAQGVPDAPLPELLRQQRVSDMQKRKSIRLARDTDAEGKPFKKPVTEGFVNVSMKRKIFFPDEAAQQEGFTPYSLDTDKEPQDETKVILHLYRGIYIPIVEKG